MSFLRDDNWLPKPDHAPTVKGQRDHLLEVRWNARTVTLRSPGGSGDEYLGSTGEDGILLVVRRHSAGGYVARIEDRKAGNGWSGQAKMSPQVAVASLGREIKRLARAGTVGRA